MQKARRPPQQTHYEKTLEDEVTGMLCADCQNLLVLSLSCHQYYFRIQRTWSLEEWHN